MLDRDKIQELAPFIKWKNVFDEAGLNPSTMRGAIRLGRELRKDEVAKILRVLSERGIQLKAEPEPELFSEPLQQGPR